MTYLFHIRQETPKYGHECQQLGRLHKLPRHLHRLARIEYWTYFVCSSRTINFQQTLKIVAGSLT